MKRFNLPKVIGASIVAVGLTLMPLTLPATAQNSPNSNTMAQAETAPDQEGDRDFDWGWLGLLGLAGLAGLRKKQEPSTQYRDPNSVGNR